MIGPVPTRSPILRPVRQAAVFVAVAVGLCLAITAAGVPYAWLRWSTGGVVPVAVMHATFNEAMQRGTAVVVATSPAALAYTTTETGVVTAMLMVGLAAYLLTRRAPVFRAGAEESRALFARPVEPAGAGDGPA